MLKTFNQNQTGRDFVVGDLHGCHDLLMSKLTDIGFDFNSDRLFCCGDLIDRGEQSYECLMLMYEPWFFSVRGNHEQMMIDVLVHGEREANWFYNGGLWSTGYEQRELITFAQEADKLLPHQIEINMDDGRKIGIIHADVGKVWRELGSDELVACLWDRSRINRTGVYGDSVKGVDRMYVGHTPTEEPVVMGNVHCMDSGAVWSGKFRIEELK